MKTAFFSIKRVAIHQATKVVFKIALGCLFGTALQASATCLDQPRLTGVNMAGAEFNSTKLPGAAGKDYTYPTDAELTFIAAQGANVIRLPFRWERIQHTALGALDDAELKRLKATVTSANAKGLCVIFDLHNYAKYYSQPLSGNTSLQDAFVDLWLRLGPEFGDARNVAFGLMNEPNYIPLADWAVLAKRTLAAIRKAGLSNLVFIAGGRWSGLHDWFSVQNGVSNATSFADVKDPLKRTYLEVHQYTDKDYSGTSTECRQATTFDPLFTKITDWAAVNGQQLFLGEFGIPQSADCLLTLERFLVLMNGSVWKGWTYWAAGGWWGGYMMALNTSVTSPSTQWPILKKYFYTPPVPKISPPSPPQPLKK